MDSADSGPDLRDYAALLRRRWRTVAAGVLAGLAAAAVALLVAPETYTATSSVQVRPTGLAELTGERSGRTNGEVNLDTEAQVVRSAQVATAAAELMGTGASAAELRERVTVTVPPNSSVLEIAYSAIGPDSARQGAEAFADAYLAHRTAEVESQVDRRLDALRKEVDSRYGELEDLAETAGDSDGGGADQIRAETRLEAVQTEIAGLNGEIDPLAALRDSIIPGQIITAATTPDAPSSPVPAVWLSGGALLGLLAGLALAVADDRGDGRLHGLRDIRRATRPPMLLDLSDDGRATRAVGLVPASGPAGQRVNGVAHTLSARMGPGGHVLVVPGASNGDAGMVAAANLAAAFARIGADVLLVCADPREAAQSAESTDPAADDRTGGREHDRLATAEHAVSAATGAEATAGDGTTAEDAEARAETAVTTTETGTATGGEPDAPHQGEGEGAARAESAGEGAGGAAAPSGSDAPERTADSGAQNRPEWDERGTGKGADGTGRTAAGPARRGRPAKVARENSGPAAGLLDLPEGPGLAEALADGVDPALLECRPEGLPGLRVLRHGRPGAAELLQREAMADLVRRLRDEARFVIIATAPTSERADAQAIAAVADAVLPTAELGRTRASELTAAVDRLAAMGTEVAGIAIVPARVGPQPVLASQPGAGSALATTTAAGTPEPAPVAGTARGAETEGPADTAVAGSMEAATGEPPEGATGEPPEGATGESPEADATGTAAEGAPAETAGNPLGAATDAATAKSPGTATLQAPDAAAAKAPDATSARGSDAASAKGSDAGTGPAEDAPPRAAANGGKRHASAVAAEPGGLTVTVPVDDVAADTAPTEPEAPAEGGIATSTSSMAPSSAAETATTEADAAGDGTSATPAHADVASATGTDTGAKSTRKGGRRTKGTAKRTTRSPRSRGTAAAATAAGSATGVATTGSSTEATTTGSATAKDTADSGTATAPEPPDGKAAKGRAGKNGTKTAPGGTQSPANTDTARDTSGNEDDQGAGGNGDATGSDLSLQR
ncbi:Wzz/FepE/Etk N-terminal domain-containing protein [Nocardiopsis mangrovi]|uniref:Wzz/FepE/Etk N-terminal domain-containing protein n=1 Tax=Nocardiopsis mangrovi TaxID=1179818 RepID=A0ABV9DU81_9ACTN